MSETLWFIGKGNLIEQKGPDAMKRALTYGKKPVSVNQSLFHSVWPRFGMSPHP